MVFLAPYRPDADRHPYYQSITDVIVLVIGDQFFENVNWKFVGINFLLYPFLVLLIALKSLSKPQWQGREINASTSPQD